MRRSKIVFIIIAILFFVILAVIAYDIASRTSFPGKKAPDTQVEN